MDDSEIQYLLEELAARGFAAWLRRKNQDGWDKKDHIHSVWVSAKLKPQLQQQVANWLIGRNGLASDLEYTFWKPSDELKRTIAIAFSQANSK